MTKLYVESTACPSSATTRHALFLTEFFNSTVDRAAYIRDSIPDGLPIDRVEVEDGLLVLPTGAPLVADYVFTAAGDRARGAARRHGDRGRVSSSGRRAARCGPRERGRLRTCGPLTAPPRRTGARGGGSRSG